MSTAAHHHWGQRGTAGASIPKSLSFRRIALSFGGKRVLAWAVEAPPDYAVDVSASNTFEMEWPPRSGRTAEFPEIDRVAWLLPDEARPLLVRGQEEALGWLEALVGVVDHEGSDPF